MKTKLMAMTLALILCLSLAVPALADGEAQIIPSLVINVPGVPGLTATLTNVSDMYYFDDKTEHVPYSLYNIFTNASGTVSFNRDVMFVTLEYVEYGINYLEFPVKAGEIVPVSSLGTDTVSRMHIFNGETVNADVWYSNTTIGTGPQDGIMLYFNASTDSDLSSLDPQRGRPISELAADPTPAPALTATPTSSTVLVNGSPVPFDAYLINDNNYFKLRDLAFVLSGSEKKFEVSWDGENNAIALTGGQSYTTVGGEMEGKGGGVKTPTATTSKVTLDGKEIKLTAYNIEGNNYFKLRDIGAAFDFEIDWDAATSTIVIDTSKGYTPD